MPTSLGSAADGVLDLPAVLIALLVTGVLVAGIKLSSRINQVIVAIKLLVVAAVIIFGVGPDETGQLLPVHPAVRAGGGGQGGFLDVPLITSLLGIDPAVYGVAGVISGAAIVFFAFIGFDVVATTAEEARNPQRDVPRGILGSLAIVTVLYMAVSLVVTGMQDYKTIDPDDAAPLATAFDSVGMEWMGRLISIGACIGLIVVVMILILGQTRVGFAMARDGLLPRGLAKVHPRFGTPYIFTIFTGVVVGAIGGLVDLKTLANLVSIGTLFAFILVSVGVVILRRTRPDLPRSFRTPAVTFVATMAVLLCLYLMLNLTGGTWVRFVVWMVIGLFVYAMYGWRHSRVRLADADADAARAPCGTRRRREPRSAHEETERVPGRVRQHVERLVRVIGPVEEQLGAELLDQLPLALQLLDARHGEVEVQLHGDVVARPGRPLQPLHLLEGEAAGAVVLDEHEPLGVVRRPVGRRLVAVAVAQPEQPAVELRQPADIGGVQDGVQEVRVLGHAPPLPGPVRPGNRALARRTARVRVASATGAGARLPCVHGLDGRGTPSDRRHDERQPEELGQGGGELRRRRHAPAGRDGAGRAPQRTPRLRRRRLGSGPGRRGAHGRGRGNGDPWRRWALAATTAAWATRLERLMLTRLRGTDKEDARYTEFLDGDPTAAVVAKVFVTQGIAQVLVSAPVQLAAASRLPGTRRRWLFPLGIAVMVVGAVVEATADRQKAEYMERDRDQRPDVLDTGLWGWSRHPNYLGGLRRLGRRLARRRGVGARRVDRAGAGRDDLPARPRHGRPGAPSSGCRSGRPIATTSAGCPSSSHARRDLPGATDPLRRPPLRCPRCETRRSAPRWSRCEGARRPTSRPGTAGPRWSRCEGGQRPSLETR